MADQIISQDLLQSIFEYKDGKLHWKISPANNVKIDDLAGSIDSHGYSQIKIKQKLYLTHRLIFLMFKGYLPKYIDHADGNRLNNKIENLREATFSQNQHNRKVGKNNTSGVKGVIWIKKQKKWSVRFKVDGKQKHFGCYKDIDYARFVVNAMRHKYHKEFSKSF